MPLTPSRAALSQSAGVILDPRRRSYLRFADVADAHFIHELRANEEIGRFLSGAAPSESMQSEWLKGYLAREEEGREFYFIIMHEGEAFGTIRLYNFMSAPDRPRDTFVWGSWILKPGRPSGLAVYSCLLSFGFGYDVLGFREAVFDVRKNNVRADRFYQHIGGVRISEDPENYYYRFPRDAYEELRMRSGSQIAEQSRIGAR